MSKIFVPHEYQIPMMDQMRYNERTGIWAPVGGGKTVCTETVLDQLDLVEDIYPVLVLATFVVFGLLKLMPGDIAAAMPEATPIQAPSTVGTIDSASSQ